MVLRLNLLLMQEIFMQSHYSHQPPASTSFPLSVSGSGPDPSSHTAHLGLPGSPFQGNLPLYQPAGSLGSWGSSPSPPTANGSELAAASPMQMYWQGYYGPPGMLPHLQQPPLLRPPSGLSIPQSMQQFLQYPGGNTLTSGSQNFQEFPSPLLPYFNGTAGLTSTTTVPLTSDPLQASSLAYEALSSQLPAKPVVSSLPAAAVGANLSYAPHLAASVNSIGSLSQYMPASVSKNPNSRPMLNVIHQKESQPTSSVFGFSNSSQTETSSAKVSVMPPLAPNSDSIQSVSQHMVSRISSNPRVIPVSNVDHRALPSSTAGQSISSQTEKPVSLVTPDQLLHSTPSAVSSSHSWEISPRNLEVKLQEVEVDTKPLLPEPPVLASVKTKEPILPLPTSTSQKVCLCLLLSFC